jgi:hypothetical protein
VHPINGGWQQRNDRKQMLLAWWTHVVPRPVLVDRIMLLYPEGKNGRLPLALETTPHVHVMQQQQFILCNPAMEDLAGFKVQVQQCHHSLMALMVYER